MPAKKHPVTLNVEARKAFQSVSGAAVKGFAAAGVAGTAAFGALAVAAARGAASQIEAGRQLQILSRQTGATVGGLFVLQQRFKAAGLSGDLVGISLERLQKALASVADVEAPKAGKRLAALGLNFAALQKMRPDQQLNTVGKAIAGLADGAEVETEGFSCESVRIVAKVDNAKMMTLAEVELQALNRACTILQAAGRSLSDQIHVDPR